MDNNTKSQPQNPENKALAQAKKPYRSPQLQIHGTVQELARTVGGGAFDDGSGPAYSS